MSYYFRDKPSSRLFSDRIRENSGDDLMETLKRQFDQDSKDFFEPAATASRNTREKEREPFDRHAGFSRGFPFDDDGFERRGNIRSHLDDLAARHPEFADHLLGPPWGDAPFLGTPRNRRRGSGLGSYSQGHTDDDTRSQASGSSAASAASGASGVSSHGDPEPYSGAGQQEPEINNRKNNIPQYGLRNTVDIGQHRHNMDNLDKINRGQRSASAPPENRQTQQQQQPQYQQPQQQMQNPNQRFVTRVDITPQQQQQGDVSKPSPQSPPLQTPPQPQPQPQPQSQPQPKQQSNVRHIPIFVEGRDEPVVPKNLEEPVFSQPQQHQQCPQSPPQFHRPSHFNQHFTNNRQQQQQWPPQSQQQPPHHFYQQHQQPPQNDQQSHTQQTYNKPNHYQQQQQEYRQQQAEKQRAQQQKQQQSEPEAEPPKLKQIQPKEPLERVAIVQNEVDSLKEQVKLFGGNSRKDKDYMYLDEMLTRELIKLDDIETEGKPNVRQARKDAIKSIQECIALLESKVPLPEQEQQNPVAEEEKPSPPMETEGTPAVGTIETEVSQIAPIPLPPAPSVEQNPLTEELEFPVSDEPMTTEMSPLEKAASGTEMETQQSGDSSKLLETQSSHDNTTNIEQQTMDIDNARNVKSLRKNRKTTGTPKPISEEPIPLPAPEISHT